MADIDKKINPEDYGGYMAMSTRIRNLSSEIAAELFLNSIDVRSIRIILESISKQTLNFNVTYAKR